MESSLYCKYEKCKKFIVKEEQMIKKIKDYCENNSVRVAFCISCLVFMAGIIIDGILK